jgi:bifunctional non-homologous end joining protein LigD
VLKRNPFIVPSALVQKQQPPSGPRWLHEVKFDGFRAQLHKHGDEVTIYSRNGHDYTRRFSAIRDSLISLPTTSVIIDAEVVVCDSDGKPDFKGLMEGATREVCAWCFDLLELKGCCFRERALVERKILLRKLLNKADDHRLRYSEGFPDPSKLLAVAESMGLEGILSKLKAQPYRSGKNSGWVKVKCQAWRASNRNRWELFEKQRT